VRQLQPLREVHRHQQQQCRPTRGGRARGGAMPRARARGQPFADPQQEVQQEVEQHQRRRPHPAAQEQAEGDGEQYEKGGAVEQQRGAARGVVGAKQSVFEGCLTELAPRLEPLLGVCGVCIRRWVGVVAQANSARKSRRKARPCIRACRRRPSRSPGRTAGTGRPPSGGTSTGLGVAPRGSTSAPAQGEQAIAIAPRRCAWRQGRQGPRHLQGLTAVRVS
jgi:hypothetical protein